MGEVTEHIHKNLQSKKRRLLKKFYVTVIHVDSMHSPFLEKYLKKKRKLSPDNQGSSKSPKTVRKRVTIPRTELKEGEKEEKKGTCKRLLEYAKKDQGKNQCVNLIDSKTIGTYNLRK